MLTQDNQAYTTQKMIAATASVSGTLMYTVPLGKAFIGKIIPSNNVGVSINGVAVSLNTGVVYDFTLVSGTSIVNLSNYGVSIVGVEQ